MLYILKAVPSGLIKIGISDQFDRRLSAIRRQNSESIEVVRTSRRTKRDSLAVRMVLRRLGN
jgi:hypothetical protein